MAMKSKALAGKIAFGLLFAVVLPLLLVAWATAADTVVTLKAVHDTTWGILLSAVGGAFILAGVFALVKHGHGLPMSPYPPAEFVSKGVFKYISHPIYTGACLVVVGVSILTGSPGGLWLVSPVFVLGCVAYVMGFEKEALRHRFPNVGYRPLLGMPEPGGEAPTAWNRISAYILVLLPFYLLDRLVLFLDLPGKASVVSLPYEQGVPVFAFARAMYMLVYPWVVLAPLLAHTKRDLREFMVSGLGATALVMLVVFILPLVSPPRGLTAPPLSFASMFPAFPVILAFIAAPVYAHRFRRLRWLWWFIALLIALACIFSGYFSIFEALGGFVVAWLVKGRRWIWQHLRRSAEALANSWREWRFGKIRLINHGFYGGLATFIGVLIVAALVGKEYLPAISLVIVTSMIFSALWAQLIEGSEQLLRPLGFYGGVVGIVVGCAVASWLFHVSFFYILAAFAVAAPWIQGTGRVRCLVQGCCHGRVASPGIGIQYRHPRSRVIRIAGLKDEYLHPTPLYSILTNIVIGLILLKLWFVSVPGAFLCGLYLVLSGLGRFVEEGYRGEPQTRVIAGLRLYQWIAVLCLAAGAALTTFRGVKTTTYLHFDSRIVLVAGALGLLSLLLTGVDFPESNKRFSRLA